VADSSTRAHCSAADPDACFEERFGPMAKSMPEFWKAMLGCTLGGHDVDDIKLRLEPMGFDVADIRVPIHAWYGAELVDRRERRRPQTGPPQPQQVELKRQNLHGNGN
jgi:hypothetical protein